MSNCNDASLEQYEQLDHLGQVQSSSLKSMIAKISPQFIMTHGSEMVQAVRELKALSIKSQAQLDALSMKYSHDSGKFSKILQGAERRLDRQLEDMSLLRRSLLSLPVSDLTPAMMQHQQAILVALSEAQDSFNRELDRLYDL